MSSPFAVCSWMSGAGGTRTSSHLPASIVIEAERQQHGRRDEHREPEHAPRGRPGGDDDQREADQGRQHDHRVHEEHVQRESRERVVHVVRRSRRCGRRRRRPGSRDRGSSAGPLITSPVAASNFEPWHGQSNSFPAAATTHCWCVQIALNATTWPAVGCAMSAGSPLIVASMLPPTGTSASAAMSSPTGGASGAAVGCSVGGSSVTVGERSRRRGRRGLGSGHPQRTRRARGRRRRRPPSRASGWCAG